MKWLLLTSCLVLISLNLHAQHSFFAGGDSNSVVLCQDGYVYVSGNNDLGQLGRGILPAINSFDIVSGIGAFGTLYSIKQISGKQSNSFMALSSSGDSVITWGSNSNGQLGNNLYGNIITNNNRYPYRVIGVGALGYLSGIKFIASGSRTNYAIEASTGKVFSWGSGNNGGLGNGTNGPDMTSPVAVLIGPGDTLKNAVSVVAGNDFALALLSNGTVWGWGRNNDGQLGQNNAIDNFYAIQVKGKAGVGFLNNIISVSVSGKHVLALSSTDTLWAWGNNADGQLGNNTNGGFSSIPVAVLNASASANLKGVTAIGADFNFSVALMQDSTISVWGNNSFGQFGNNTFTSALVPTKALNEIGSLPIKAITAISTLSGGVFAKRANGDLLGWGDNRYGQLGLGDNISRQLPTVIALPCIVASSPTFLKGTITGPSSVCSSVNTGIINLSGTNGTIVAWQSSINNFASYTVTASSNASFVFSAISQTTYYRAVVQFNDQLMLSDSWTVLIDQPSIAGALGLPATICAGTNTGSLNLSGYTGGIINWESSLDSFATAGTVIVNSLASYTYTNLNASTFYRVIIKNGLCQSDTSAIVKITVNSVSVGGSISPSNTVCFGSNSGTMTLSGYNGAILGWEYSSDNFTGFINPIANVSVSQSYLNLTVTTYYRAILKNGVCSSVYSAVNSITVDPLSSGGSLTPSAVVCSGTNSGALTLNSYVGSIIEWESASDNLFTIINPIVNTSPVLNYNNLIATTFYRVKIKSGVCPTVYSPFATITATPISSGGTVNGATTVCALGNSGTLSLVSTVGTVLEWQSSNDNFVTTILIANTTLSLSYTNITSTTQYRAVVKNGSCPIAYALPAEILVDAVTSEGILSASAVLCSGSNVSLTLGGTIVGSIVQWESSTDNFSTIVNPIVNTTTVYNYLNITATTSYRVRVKNGVCPFQNSNVAVITVDGISVGGSVNTSASECTGTNSGVLNLTGHFGSILYWETSTDNFTTVTNLANISTSQSYLNIVVKTDFRAIIKNGVCPSVMSTSATITVYPITAGGSISSPAIVCFGNNIGTLNLIGNTGSIVHWEKSTNNFSTFTTISNITSSESYSNLVATTSYRALVKNGNCAAQYSSTVDITVNPASVGGVISGSATVCISSNGGNISVAGFLGSIVQWETSTDNFSSVIVPIYTTATSIAYTNLTTTTYFRAQIQNSGCTVVYPTPAIITVDPISVGGTLTAPAVVCANSNSGAINLSGEYGSILRWETSLDNFISDITSIPNSTSTENYLNLTATSYYRAVVKSGVCAFSYSNITAVTVNPASIGGDIIGARNVCIDGNSGSLVLLNQSGTILQWETTTNNFSSFIPIVTTNNTYNYNNIIVPTSIRVLVQYSPCPAVYSPVFSFIVNPTTKGGVITGNTQVPPGENSGLLTLYNFVGGIVQWEYAEDTSIAWKNISVNSNGYEFTNLDTSIFVRVLVKSVNCPQKYSEVFHIVVSEIINKEVKIYPTISPNNDNINDEWIIDNITLNPGNQVKVFNRWGDLVYEQSGYDNINNVWKGHSNVRLTVSGRDLPEGTYFYVVNLGNGKPELSGYVVLNR